MRETYIIFIVALATCVRGELSSEDIPAPEKRLISTFQIVRFPNEACIGSSSRNGTCYTSAECSDKGGSSSGSCADGFGVCCTFIITACGMTSSQNITYWDQTPTDDTSNTVVCNLDITPINDNICQLRIDFDAFVITGPSTSAVDEHVRLRGQVPILGTATKTDANWRSNCLVDRFSVNGVSSSNQPPTICGTNTGYHMYVDAAEVNTMSFRLGAKAGNAPAAKVIDTRGVSATATRNWDIKVLQYECGHLNAAPPGCTQYYWGQTKGLITTYNFAGSEALANQNQKVCIRRERAVCYVCFSGTGTEFGISGNDNAANAYTFPGLACGYAAQDKQAIVADGGVGIDNTKAGAYDCGIVPGAFLVAKQSDAIYAVATTTTAKIRTLTNAEYQVPVGPQISSRGTFGVGVGAGALSTLVVAGSATDATICSKHVPFMMIFKSDDHEGLGAGAEYLSANNKGINIPWWTVTCKA